MIRIDITIGPKQHTALKAARKATGLAVSDLIRRLVDEHLAALVQRVTKRGK